jgi:hypothetical protein
MPFSTVLIFKDCATEIRLKLLCSQKTTKPGSANPLISLVRTELSITLPYTRIGEEVIRDRITVCIPHMAIPKTSNSPLLTYGITTDTVEGETHQHPGPGDGGLSPPWTGSTQ